MGEGHMQIAREGGKMNSVEDENLPKYDHLSRKETLEYVDRLLGSVRRLSARLGEQRLAHLVHLAEIEARHRHSAP
jgi:hypothetical protein